jgi:hypothetical protein
VSESGQRTAFVCGNPQTQGVELDEARCVSLVVRTAIFFEGSDVGVEQRVVGLAAGEMTLPL